MLLVNGLHIGSQAASSDRYARVDRNAQAIWLGRYALPLFYPLRMNSLLRKMGLLSEERTRLTGLFDIGTSRFREGAFELACDTAAPRRNVLYIVLDAFRADCLNDSVTPRLWQFGQEHAMRFTKHRSGASQTTGGIFSLFYGLPQLYGNALLGQRVAPPVVERAIAEGYSIRTFPSSSLRDPDFAGLLFAHVPGGVTTDTPGETAYERDCHIAGELKAFLDTVGLEDRFFAFAFFDLPHAKQLPLEQLGRFQPSWAYADFIKTCYDNDATGYFNLYRNCVYADDRLLGPILKTLESRGLLHNTVVVVTGDHGEEFNDSGNDFWCHNVCLDSWETCVPLLLSTPDIEPGVAGWRTSHYDVSGTVLRSAYGVTTDAERFSCGRLLTDTASRDSLLLSRCAVDWSRFDKGGGDYHKQFLSLAVGDNLLDVSPGRLELTDDNLRKHPI